MAGARTSSGSRCFANSAPRRWSCSRESPRRKTPSTASFARSRETSLRARPTSHGSARGSRMRNPARPSTKSRNGKSVSRRVMVPSRSNTAMMRRSTIEMRAGLAAMALLSEVHPSGYGEDGKREFGGRAMARLRRVYRLRRDEDVKDEPRHQHEQGVVTTAVRAGDGKAHERDEKQRTKSGDENHPRLRYRHPGKGVKESLLLHPCTPSVARILQAQPGLGKCIDV